jgi:hypothetical protein
MSISSSAVWILMIFMVFTFILSPLFNRHFFPNLTEYFNLLNTGAARFLWQCFSTEKHCHTPRRTTSPNPTRGFGASGAQTRAPELLLPQILVVLKSNLLTNLIAA